MEMNDTPRLFLLDAYALIFRAYYALIRAPRLTSQGFNTSAVYGFTSTLEELLRSQSPTHIAVCFDPQGPTFRHEAYADYKGGREATPEDIKSSIPVIKEILGAYNIPVIEVPGFEADDVIGTLAVRAAEAGFTAYMMTPDKDFGQLVSERIMQYKPSYRGSDYELRDEAAVCERYGIDTPRQVIDLLALMGDKADNIPGCPGVGEKTASRLIREYGSVEKLISASSSIKGALRRKIEENADQILFSKYLATIRTDVPVDAELDALLLREPDKVALLEIFSRLEFRTLAERLKRRLEAAPAQRNVQGSLFDFEAPDEPVSPAPASGPEVEMVEVTGEDDCAALLERARRCGRVGVCTVLNGETDMTATLLGWLLTLPDAPERVMRMGVNVQGAAGLVESLYADAAVEVVSAQVKRDYVCLHRLTCREPQACNYFDVTVAHYLLHPDMRHSMEQIASSVLSLTLLQESGGGDPFVSAAPGVALLLSMRDRLSEQLQEKEMGHLFDSIELPLVTVLARMEITGVRVDTGALNAAASSLSARLSELEVEIYSMAGVEFNISSPAKVGEVLFDRLALSAKPKKTRTGQYSTSEEELEKIAHLSPIVGKILEYRQLKKLITTYLTALPNTVNPATGRIHTTFNQTVTATGRISSSDPNLQNIPVREAVGREIRRAFIPDEGHLFMAADYSQIELRLVADFAGDTDMLAAFSRGDDIHAMTAAKIFHKPQEQVTAGERRMAKTANFGILYGISAFGLSQRLGIPRSEAKELIDNYFEQFPSIHGYITRSVEQARERGYVSTIEGRRRPLPDISSRNATVRGYAERNAVNAPVQGSAADIIKIAMVEIDRGMRSRGMRSRMIMQVHDELDFDVVPAELDALRSLVVSCMEGAYTGRVRLTASVGVGADWLEAH